MGNRAYGERISALADPQAVRAALALLLLAPSIPLLFMGEEFAAGEPFLFFCDFEPDLAAAVRRGRRREFARFSRFADAQDRDRIPDPGDAETYRRCVLGWEQLQVTAHRDMHALTRELLALRAQHIVPRLPGLPVDGARFEVPGTRSIVAQWILGDASKLTVLANLSDAPLPAARRPTGMPLFPGRAVSADGESDGVLAGWTVQWFLDA